MKKRNILLKSILLGGLIIGSTVFASEQKKVPVSLALTRLGYTYNENWEVFNLAAEKTGVKLVPFYPKNVPSDQAKQSYNLMISSGEIADIIANLPSELEKLGSEGGMIPLNDLIKQHAPNIKAFMEKHPDLAKDMYALDGNIYSIPSYCAMDIKTSTALFIRKDWLDKYNLPMPQTLEELEKALTTFRDKDANGNGKKDEVGIVNRDHALTLLSTFGVRSGLIPYYEENGKIIYEPITPAYKDALKYAADFYKKGLMDPEVFTRGPKARDILFGNNQASFISDWIPSTSSYNKILKDTIPGFKLVPVPPLAMPNGEKSKQIARPTIQDGAWGISIQAKDPVAAIKFMDWWFSPEGQRAWNFGIEGKSYTMQNGKPIFTDFVLKNPSNMTPVTALYSLGAQQIGVGVVQDGWYEEQQNTPESVDAIRLYSKPGMMVPPLPILKYTLSENDELVKINVDLDRTREEYMQKWILGASNIEKDWDEYVKHLKSLGLDRALQIQQKAFEARSK